LKIIKGTIIILVLIAVLFFLLLTIGPIGVVVLMVLIWIGFAITGCAQRTKALGGVHPVLSGDGSPRMRMPKLPQEPPPSPQEDREIKRAIWRFEAMSQEEQDAYLREALNDE